MKKIILYPFFLVAMIIMMVYTSLTDDNTKEFA
jgi:hypothetical protein